MNLTDRQLILLGYIIQEYVKTGTPIASSSLIEKYNLNIAPATVRYEMVALEELGLLEKPHTSGGRIPTSKGYETYIQKTDSNPNSLSNLKKQIKKIFEDRTKSIDEILDTAILQLNEATKSISLSKKDFTNAKLEDLKVYKINNDRAMILAVFSNGTVNNYEFELNAVNFDDLATSIHIFVDKSKGIILNDLKTTALNLRSVLEEQVKNLEKNYQDFINKLFNGLLSYEYDYSISGDLVPSTNIDSETIMRLMQSLKDQTIWEMLSKTKNVEKNSTKVTVDLHEAGLNKLSAITKSFKVDEFNKEITLIGSSDKDYNEIIEVLDIIEEQVKKFRG